MRPSPGYGRGPRFTAEQRHQPASTRSMWSANMAQQIERLARFVAETALEQVPKEVQRHAKLVVLDTIGVILAGANRPEVRGLRERLNATAGIGATIFRPPDLMDFSMTPNRRLSAVWCQKTEFRWC